MVKDGWPVERLSAPLLPGAFANARGNLAPSDPNPLDDVLRALVNDLNKSKRVHPCSHASRCQNFTQIASPPAFATLRKP